MSLATWGHEAREGDVVLPIIEYDEFNRTAATIPVEPPGLEGVGIQPDSLCAAMGRVGLEATAPRATHNETRRGSHSHASTCTRC